MTETYYTRLEVPRSASPAEVKEAFIKLIRQVHPDLLANVPEYWKKQAEEKSKDINEAYRVLSDPEKRRSYDQQLDACRQEQAQDARAANPHSDEQGASSSTAASSRRPARARPTALPSFWRGRVAALIRLLVIVGLVGLLADLILGRRTSTSTASAVPEIQLQPNVRDTNAAKKRIDQGVPARVTRTARSAAPDTSTTGQDDTGGQVMQWNARTRSWQPAKPFRGIAGKGVQSYLEWNPETNSWLRSDRVVPGRVQ